LCFQTEKIVMLDKWTQRPPAASILSAEEDFELFMQNVRGCGGQVGRFNNYMFTESTNE
jgi:hypothetical protein